MIEKLDEKILNRFDNKNASDHEIKLMLIAKIHELIETSNSQEKQLNDCAAEFVKIHKEIKDIHTILDSKANY